MRATERRGGFQLLPQAIHHSFHTVNPEAMRFVKHAQSRDRLNLPSYTTLAKPCPETHPKRFQTTQASRPHPQTPLCKHTANSTPIPTFAQRLSSSRQNSQAFRKKLGYGCMFDLRNPMSTRQGVGVYNAGLPFNGSRSACRTFVQCTVLASSFTLSSFDSAGPARFLF